LAVLREMPGASFGPISGEGSSTNPTERFGIRFASRITSHSHIRGKTDRVRMRFEALTAVCSRHFRR
jgi:hypothetical protein